MVAGVFAVGFGLFSVAVLKATPEQAKAGTVPGKVKEWCCRAVSRYGALTQIATSASAYLEKVDVKPLSAPLAAIVGEAGGVQTQQHSLLGRTAPEFKLVSPKGRSYSLSEARASGPVILVFYYGYHCDHCVAQLFALHRDVAYFDELGATIIAVSADPPKLTDERFREYGKFAFQVLSDPEHKIAMEYKTAEAPKKPGDDPEVSHGTFVIDKDGIVRWANVGDTPFTDNRTLIKEVARLTRAGGEGSGGL